MGNASQADGRNTAVSPTIAERGLLEMAGTQPVRSRNDTTERLSPGCLPDLLPLANSSSIARLSLSLLFWQ